MRKETYLDFTCLNKYIAGALTQLTLQNYTSNRLRGGTGDPSDQTQHVIATTVDALGKCVQAGGKKIGSRRNGTISFVISLCL